MPSIEFSCDDPLLEAGFAWAKAQALAYVRRDGPIGPWYEAALPGRDAFCIRDAAHQRAGAAMLGLGDCTYNMFRRFAGSMHPDRDDCMYWEIDKTGGPAPVDYTNDRDFWYNLPASFDLLQACRQEYLWSGDERYIEDKSFLRFYETTRTRYIERWDRDGDGIPDHRPRDGRRGIASYNEAGISPRVSGDMLGAMFAAYRASGQEERALALRERYLGEWYDAKRGRFYGAKDRRGRFVRKYCHEGHFLPVYFGLLDGTTHLRAALEEIRGHGPANVEGKTYFPAIYFGRGMEEEGLRELRELCSPKLRRREYPEVSFAAVSSIVQQYMGVTVIAPKVLRTCAPLDTQAQVRQLPVFGERVTLRQDGQSASTLTPEEGAAFTWRACFMGGHAQLYVDGRARAARMFIDAAGRTGSYVDVEMDGRAVTVSAGKGRASL